MCLYNCDIRSISGKFLGGIHFHIPSCICYVEEIKTKDITDLYIGHSLLILILV